MIAIALFPGYNKNQETRGAVRMSNEEMAMLQKILDKAEHDAMKMDMAYMMGDIKSLKNSMCAVENATAYNWGEIAKLKKAQ